MSVDEDSSSSEEGEKDSSSDSDSGSDSDSNDERKDHRPPPSVMSPPRQEEQEGEQASWCLKNFLKKSTPDTNNTTRTSQQVRATDRRSRVRFPDS